MTLSRLHSASAGAERDDAWARFVADHTDLVLRVCRAVMRDADGAMDAYAFVLQSLHANDCARLRGYSPNGHTRFTTWLTVVTRRLVLDFIRERYGRARGDDDHVRATHRARRRLEDLIGEAIEPEQLPDERAIAPDLRVQHGELRDTLRRAVAKLDPEDRLLLALRFADDRSVREIARAMHFPSVFHVYRRLAAVLRTIRAFLEHEGVEGPDA